MRRRALLTSALAALALTALPRESDAQLAVTCPTCDQLWQQLLAYAQEAKSYLTQLAQYQAEFNSWMQLIIAGVTLPGQVFSGVMGDINQVRSLIQAVSLLSGNTGSMINKLMQAGAIANSAAFLPTTVALQTTMWANTLGNMSNKLGTLFTTQGTQQATSTAMQVTAQAHSIAAIGQMQAISATNEAIGVTNYTLNQIQGTITQASQQAATRDVIAANRQQLNDQMRYQFFNLTPDLPTGGWPSY